MATIDLDDLRKEIEDDKKRLSEKEAVLRFLEGRVSNIPVSASIVRNDFPSKDDGIISLDTLIPEIKRRTVIDDIHDVVGRFGNQEFTVVHVEAALKKTGYEFKGDKSPRPRISTALGKLEDQGVIVRSFEGKGNVPHRYKLKGEIDEL
jgi:DNA-binding transcriptional ArsR family regulator